jgi:transcriptional regulator with XRE-family HTH domain
MEYQFEGAGVHVGHNIANVRRSIRMSQIELASRLEDKRGRPVSQQLMSDIENRKEIDDDELLQQIAECLNVAPDFLKEADYEKILQIVSNTFNNSDHAINPLGIIYNFTVNNFESLEKEKAEMAGQIKKLEAELERLRKQK